MKNQSRNQISVQFYFKIKMAEKNQFKRLLFDQTSIKFDRVPRQLSVHTKIMRGKILKIF